MPGRHGFGEPLEARALRRGLGASMREALAIKSGYNRSHLRQSPVRSSLSQDNGAAHLP